MRAYSMICVLLLALAAGSYAATQPKSQTLQQVPQDQAASTPGSWVFPLLSESNRTCTATCNGEEVAQSTLHEANEAKSCVGTFKVFCKGNNTNGFGVFAVKCEGKITTFANNKTVSICEGAFSSFVSKGFKGPDGKFVKTTGAYGCLGTSIGLRSAPNKTSLASMEWSQFGQERTGSEDWLAGVSDEGTYAEARCDGLNGRFDAIKITSDCKHGKGDKGHGKGNPWGRDDEERPQPPQPEDDAESEQLRDGPGHAQKEGRQGRHLLGNHKDKHHDHAGKSKHDGEGKHKGKDKHDKDTKDKHHNDDHIEGKLHGKHWKQSPENMTFEDVQGKVEHVMKKSGMKLLPHDLPYGSALAEGPNGPHCQVTCNGKPTWFGGFFPCFGELVVDCKAGQRKPGAIANSPLDADISSEGPEGGAPGQPRGPAFHGTCKGLWTGALFKSCRGFSSAHVEAGPRDVWDFCSGKKAIRMGGAPGKGFASGSWCKGKSLLVVDKE